MIRDALTRLRQACLRWPRPPPKECQASQDRSPTAKKPLSIEEIHRQMLASGLLTSLPDPALDIDDDDPDDQPDPHQGRAAVRNHPPRAALRWPSPTSSIPVPWSNATSRRSAPPGSRDYAPQPSTVIYIARITAVEVPCAIARRRKGKTLTAAASIVDPPPLSPAPRRAVCRRPGDARLAGRRHAGWG